MQFLIRFIINAIVLWLVVCLVPGFTNGAGGAGFGAFGVWTIIILAIIFGIVNALLGPVLRLVSAPITWLTHGIFSIVVNWIVFGLAVWISPGIKGGWLPTLIGAIILMIISTLLQQMWKTDAERGTAAAA